MRTIVCLRKPRFRFDLLFALKSERLDITYCLLAKAMVQIRPLVCLNKPRFGLYLSNLTSRFLNAMLFKWTKKEVRRLYGVKDFINNLKL